MPIYEDKKVQQHRQQEQQANTSVNQQDTKEQQDTVQSAPVRQLYASNQHVDKAFERLDGSVSIKSESPLQAYKFDSQKWGDNNNTFNKPPIQRYKHSDTKWGQTETTTPQTPIQHYQHNVEQWESTPNPPTVQKQTQSPTPPQMETTPVVQKQENNTGMPDNLKSGVENLSGLDMSDVKVHYNSDKPAQLQAHAYAQGTDIHLGPGQEKHLPHEAWHVVQQKQGRVKPTMQMKGVNVNDDSGLEKEADEMGGKAQSSKINSNKSTLYKNITLQRKNIVVQRIATYYGQMMYAKQDCKFYQRPESANPGWDGFWGGDEIDKDTKLSISADEKKDVYIYITVSSGKYTGKRGYIKTKFLSTEREIEKSNPLVDKAKEAKKIKGMLDEGIKDANYGANVIDGNYEEENHEEIISLDKLKERFKRGNEKSANIAPIATETSTQAKNESGFLGKTGGDISNMSNSFSDIMKNSPFIQKLLSLLAKLMPIVSLVASIFQSVKNAIIKITNYRRNKELVIRMTKQFTRFDETIGEGTIKLLEYLDRKSGQFLREAIGHFIDLASTIGGLFSPMIPAFKNLAGSILKYVGKFINWLSEMFTKRDKNIDDMNFLSNSEHQKYSFNILSLSEKFTINNQSYLLKIKSSSEIQAEVRKYLKKYLKDGVIDNNIAESINNTIANFAVRNRDRRDQTKNPFGQYDFDIKKASYITKENQDKKDMKDDNLANRVPKFEHQEGQSKGIKKTTLGDKIFRSLEKKGELDKKASSK